jgi:hypothetical protein
MLVCGNFETELDFRTAPSMRESLIAANLIGDRMDTESLRAYSRQLIQLMIKDILPGTPISLRRLDEYIVSAKNVFDRVLLSNDIPVTEISGGNNGVVRRGRCGAQSAVLGPEGREMKFSKKY